MFEYANLMHKCSCMCLNLNDGQVQTLDMEIRQQAKPQA